MIKLCVGADTPADLVAWRKRRAAEGHKPVVHTRQTPKRAAEILDGGSLYWVFKGQILIRQPILAIETIPAGPRTRCEILLGDDMIATVPQPRRAFQGWRYFEASDAPPDLAGQDAADLPQELARQLREIGAW
ncbi:MAG TPA: DUF1489 domain-containing protein [Caulobacteraceae bacterium]|jgi:hypothetical protein|nr:DUF1489 domain-containing protein [Caulobacteraceae bacterium]